MWEFYTTLFGWKQTDAMQMGDAGEYRMYGNDERTFGGFMNRPDELPAALWLPYVTLGDLDEATERVGRLGGSVVHGPAEVPGGDRVTILVDNQGAPFALHEGSK